MKTLSSASPLKTGRYLQSNKLFFNSSKLFAAQITDLLDFIWPTASAMWNLRWQVNGYVNMRDQTLTVEELFSKFGTDNKIMRANLYRACIDSTWENQLEQFGQVLLINAFAFYESWLNITLSELGVSNPQKLEKQLQQPSNHPNKGITDAVATITSSESMFFKNTFYPIFSQNEKNALHELNNLMICYRYFKELRNAIIHRGGIVNPILATASGNYDLLTEIDLKAKEKPAYFSFSNGDTVKIDIRGVVGFLDILLKIVTTLDAEFMRSINAEVVLLAKWKESVGVKSVKKSQPERNRQLISMAKRNCLPKPISLTALESWLIQHDLIN